MLNLGTVTPGSTITIPFETVGSSGESITMSGFATSDIKVYKGSSMTERASTNGYTLLDTDGIDIDSGPLTGIHGFQIDLADNTTAGFWTAGSDYFVVVDSITVNSQTVRFIAAKFRIGYDGAMIDTTISGTGFTSQTVFRLSAGPAEDDALNGCPVLIHDIASGVQVAAGIILDYTGSTKEVTLAANPTFTVATGDNISVFRRVDLSHILGTIVPSSGKPGVNVEQWGGTNVPASDTNGYPKVTIKSGTGTGEISITSGVVASSVSSMGNNVITSSVLDSTAVNEIADQVWDETIAGHATAGSAGKVLTTIAADAATIGDVLDTLGSAVNGTVSQDIADVRTVVDSVSGRIPAALISGRIDSTVGAMQNSVLTAAALASDAVTEILTTTMTESYATAGSGFSLAQGMYMIYQIVGQFGVAGVTITGKKIDGSDGMTFTINDASNPTSRSRAT